MPKKITFINLPIYSIATFKSYIYFSGGGGGKTGIPNQLLIFHRTVTPNPAARVTTGTKIYQNLTVSLKYQLLACSANENLLMFQILENGKDIKLIGEVEVDKSFKNATINTICFHAGERIVTVGGDDGVVRWYKIGDRDSKVFQLIWEHNQHREPIRKIDSKQKDLFVSNDTQVAVIANLATKQILRKLYRDQLSPPSSVLQSSYFHTQTNPSNTNLLLCHYIPRKESYLTRELPHNKFLTLQLSKDQSCATAKQGKYLGLACGQGATYMVDVDRMECVGKEKGHQFVITAGVVTKGGRFITGTSSCSYLVQEPQGGGDWRWVLAILLVVLVVVLVGLAGGGYKISEIDRINVVDRVDKIDMVDEIDRAGEQKSMEL